MVSIEDFEILRQKLVTYEAQQVEAAGAMRAEVAQQVGQVAEGLNNLYAKAETALIEMARRIEEVEKYGGKGGGGKQKSLINVKDMKLNKLEKNDEWKRWKADLEDYAEEIFPGIRDILDSIKDRDDEIDDLSFKDGPEDWWSKAGMLWRFFENVYRRGFEEDCDKRA
jgi:hypothetical protein